MKHLAQFYPNLSLLLLAVFVSSMTLVSCTTDDEENTDETNVTLSQAEKDMLIQMREEEKLARDVYDYLYTSSGLQVFDNISNSEQMHMDKILVLLEKYNIPDPVLPNAGAFSNPDLQNLYNQLIATGEASNEDALTVGATIEDLDIYDLDEFSALTNNADILEVFENLNCGSRNHMRAFYSQLSLLGITYTPQYISQTKLDEIINSSHEQCNN